MKTKSGNPNSNVSYSNFLIDNFNLDFQIQLSERLVKCKWEPSAEGDYQKNMKIRMRLEGEPSAEGELSVQGELSTGGNVSVE